jgi:hypothetical protein
MLKVVEWTEQTEVVKVVNRPLQAEMSETGQVSVQESFGLFISKVG